jgi:hypothetical protein
VFTHEQTGSYRLYLTMKEFVDKKPHTMHRLTDAEIKAFPKYREQMMEVIK